MFPKVKRIQNKALIQAIGQRSCIICGMKNPHVHHVTTRGAGGDDVENNLVPLCSAHHTEIHQVGNQAMADKYPAFHIWIEIQGRNDLLKKGN